MRNPNRWAESLDVELRRFLDGCRRISSILSLLTMDPPSFQHCALKSWAILIF